MNSPIENSLHVTKSSVGRPRQYASNAERVAACRARKKTKTLSVQISQETFDALEQFLKFKDETKEHAVERALKNFLRKR